MCSAVGDGRHWKYVHCGISDGSSEADLVPRESCEVVNVVKFEGKAGRRTVTVAVDAFFLPVHPGSKFSKSFNVSWCVCRFSPKHTGNALRDSDWFRHV